MFNILLPTWDVFSDVKLSVNLIIGGKQGCLIEEENVEAFKKEFELCLQSPQEYCQSDSVASYLTLIQFIICPRKAVFSSSDKHDATRSPS